MVPDRHGTGTNALLLHPATAIPPGFGPGSLARHTAAAEEAGVTCNVDPVPSLVLDIDTPDDLDALRGLIEEASWARARHQWCAAPARPLRRRRSPGFPAPGGRAGPLTPSLSLTPLAAPDVAPGDDLAAALACRRADVGDGDVLVVAHKVVSKAEGASGGSAKSSRARRRAGSPPSRTAIRDWCRSYWTNRPRCSEPRTGCWCARPTTA